MGKVTSDMSKLQGPLNTVVWPSDKSSHWAMAVNGFRNAHHLSLGRRRPYSQTCVLKRQSSPTACRPPWARTQTVPA